jgi:hypothetical protein
MPLLLDAANPAVNLLGAEDVRQSINLVNDQIRPGQLVMRPRIG